MTRSRSFGVSFLVISLQIISVWFLILGVVVAALYDDDDESEVDFEFDLRLAPVVRHLAARGCPSLPGGLHSAGCCLNRTTSPGGPDGWCSANFKSGTVCSSKGCGDSDCCVDDDLGDSGSYGVTK